MNKQLLHDNWRLKATADSSAIPAAVQGAEVVAQVPGCVHLDLMVAGLIPDPYLDRNELEVQWIGGVDWEYVCSFAASGDVLAEEQVELVCEGLDTVALVELNGVEIGRGENMHVLYRFDAKEHLREGENELRIVFQSAERYAEGHQERLGDLPNAYPTPFNFIRKMACNFGWDWGPTLVTAGIWQPIYLQGWSGVRLESVRPLVVAADEQWARIEVHAELAGDAEAEIRCVLRGIDGDEIAASGRGGVVVLEVEKPQLWWPVGFGDQPLYDLAVTVGEDVWAGRIGLRTVALDTEADEIGAAFALAVNGCDVFCKGANWIPDDCFPTRIDRARYRERIEQALGANMNMLRIWGGGLYEQRDFYELCDELGVLVWQDFPFACAAYPEEPPFAALVEAEARYQIARLSQHPSLVLWNGNNENIWGWRDWGWQEQTEGRTWGLGFYLELLPRLVAELDPTRPYWPGSPYSGSMEIHPNDDDYGNKHVWDAWNQKDYAVYRDYCPRFASEFGHQAPPSYALIRRAITTEDLRPDSEAMLHHQKALGGNDKLASRLGEHFAVPEHFDDWLYLTQLNQARAMSVGVEWYRSRQPICMGTLYWQLNDCWPVTSWAAIDGDGRPKPLWYATRRFYKDRLLTIQPEADNLVLYALNDTDAEWRSEAVVERRSFSGEVLSAVHVEMVVVERSCARVLELGRGLTGTVAAATELIVASAGPERGLWFFNIDRWLDYPQPDFSARLEREGDRYQLSIVARTLLRDVCVFADRLDAAAHISEQLVTLLPGEEHTFTIESTAELDLGELTQPPVLQCANRFGLNLGYIGYMGVKDLQGD